MILYGKPNCGACDLAKEWLGANEIKYEYRNVKNRENAAEYRRLKLNTLPVLVTEINGKKIAIPGFRPDLYAELVKLMP